MNQKKINQLQKTARLFLVIVHRLVGRLDMRYWKDKKHHEGIEGIKLTESNDSFDILNIQKMEDGKIRIEEECDNYFFVDLSRSDAIAVLQEAIEWIKSSNS